LQHHSDQFELGRLLSFLFIETAHS